MPTADGRAKPQQGRSQQTYERLLDVAGELVAEQGFESISTNLICARAGFAPSALYRYFKDKYGVLEALGERLMVRQNEALEAWVARHQPGGLDHMRSHIGELLHDTAVATNSVPGAVWILRALHASPRMVSIRLESHRYVTDRLTEAYASYLPGVDREELWRRLRLSVEVGFAIDEMLQEEDRVSPEAVMRQTAQMLRASAIE
ncbi:TetR/AcrR family transcriptional regulator [Sphingomonas montanisoli]|uniref:TetR/AcrR family transcriptional regulator n=1 Tax=Sphingomonas montanisoli TaxID=2606412 RepID=A0A5D9CCP6_9SPHN|nr:TetR/AcrR family transcriptional regulator [Sphingomonas montanisoli]TZG29449.1 TetR/AcrR family transcriptional regulator [Sphingomonas montanisoli]